MYKDLGGSTYLLFVCQSRNYFDPMGPIVTKIETLVN